MMRIVSVTTHILEAPLSKPFRWSFDQSKMRTSCIVEIETDTGLRGWGECFGPARLNGAAVEFLAGLVLGEDPLATERLWMRMYNQSRDNGRKGLMITALSGIDIALWDLKGKHFGAPISQLMGGPLRTSVEAYATGTYRHGTADPLDYILPEVQGYVEKGFRAVKLKIGFNPDEDAALIREVRRVIGPDIGLMLDANHGYDVVDSIRLCRLIEDLDIGWLEEPVVPEDIDAYRELRNRQPIPIAGGECEFTRWGFREIFEKRAIDVLQPDTCAAGGLSECKKIADMAACFGVRYVPHVWGTAIGMAAALNLLAVVPDTPPRHTPKEPVLEYDRSEHPFREKVATEWFGLEDGRVRIPDGPGLGITIDEEVLGSYRVASARVAL